MLTFAADEKQKAKDMITTTDLIIRAVVAAILGGAIGLERGYRAKEAGFRTHFLVALGSALFMILSQYGFDDIRQESAVRLDPSRIAAQVVSGIGFIGAGTIIFQKHVVKGLTTAAGLWVASAIGLACGSGQFVLASAVTVLVILCLEAVNVLHRTLGSKNISITLTTPNKENIRSVLESLRREDTDMDTYEMKMQETPKGMVYVVSMEVKVRRKHYESKLAELMNFEGVTIESMK